MALYYTIIVTVFDGQMGVKFDMHLSVVSFHVKLTARTIQREHPSNIIINVSAILKSKNCMVMQFSRCLNFVISEEIVVIPKYDTYNFDFRRKGKHDFAKINEISMQ